MPQNAALQSYGMPNSATMPQGDALQSLAAVLCKLNSDVWNFDVPPKDVLATFKEALAARESALATVVGDNQPTDFEPRRKKQRQLGGDQLQPPEDHRRELVLQEVVRILEANGGALSLHKIGTKSLSDLRKGVVGNLRSFLMSRPDVFAMTEQESEGNGSSPLVSLVGAL